MAADPLLPSLPHEEQLPTMASEEAIIDDAPVAHSFTTIASSPPWLAHQRGRSRNFQSTLSETVSPSDLSIVRASLKALKALVSLSN